jgi:hypothetical protein
VKDLESDRHLLAQDTRHALYGPQAERWLESMVRDDVTRVDANLNPRFLVHPGVCKRRRTKRNPRCADGHKERPTGNSGTQATAYLHLPLQAADYWLRIRRHRLQGDFSNHGYFCGIQLKNTPQLLYLVTPALHFHPTTDILLRYISPHIEFVQVGLAEGWRRGRRVVMRR